MRRLEVIAFGRLEWVEGVTARITADDDVIVRLVASTTCDLDRAIIAGFTPFAFPFAVGHEGVGENASACSPRPVDLCDEIEEAGQVSELTVEAQGGIAVNTNTKDSDSGAGVEA